MAKTATIRARTETDLKVATDNVLAELGLTPTQAITFFDREIVHGRAIPFPLPLAQPARFQE